LRERLGFPSALRVLDLFGSLPEEETGTDCGAEDAHHHGGGVGFGVKSGQAVRSATWPQGMWTVNRMQENQSGV
jgi:hypothetical protein